ncbi:esterase/lipase family protein [Streptomyces xantholiticus]
MGNTVLRNARRGITSTLLIGGLAIAVATGPALASASNSGESRASLDAKCTDAKLEKGKLVRDVTPVLFVHGFTDAAQMWTGGKVAGSEKEYAAPKVRGSNKTLVDMVSEIRAVATLTFNYSRSSTNWVTTPENPKQAKSKSVAQMLADTISCLNDATGKKVIVVAHSMGGLATQWAAGSRKADPRNGRDGGGGVANKISAVITLGTPYKGSWVAECTLRRGLYEGGRWRECSAARALFKKCNDARKFDKEIPADCEGLPDEIAQKSKATGALANKNSEISKLPAWPSKQDGGPAVYPLAGKANLIKWSEKYGLVGTDIGDKVVSVKSAIGGMGKSTVAACKDEGDDSCFHPKLPQNPILAKTVVERVRDSARTTPQMPPRKNVDWNNQRYGLTCDYIADAPVQVSLRNGKGIATGSGIGGGYDRWEVRLQRTAHGTLPGLGDVTAVLFYCSPQPSNFYVQEVRVYRTRDGSEIGRTPSFKTSNLSPQYQPRSLAIKNGRILADVKFYGPNDSHASGPSILRHVTWSWDGRKFVKRSEVDSAPGRIDFGRKHVTVNGIGPLRIGMSGEQVEKASGMPIATVGDYSHCADGSIEGAPQGLSLRFVEGKLVAISVSTGASSIATASGIHIGSTRDEVLRTYSGEVTVESVSGGFEYLVFAPKDPQFDGRVIVFSVRDERVEAFAAGERDWANFDPCP